MGIACEEAKSSNSINRLHSNKNLKNVELLCIVLPILAYTIWVLLGSGYSQLLEILFFWKGNNRSSGSLWKEWMDLNILMRDRKFFVKMWRLHHIFCFIWYGIFLWCIASLFFWRKVLLKKLKIIWCGNTSF